MENGIWNGRLLIAAEIARDYQLEKEIRKASGYKELRCPDPECQHPILRYCHGDKKDAFFAHLNNESCDYAAFDRSNTQIMRNIRKIIYEHFKSIGYEVYPEVKVLDHHYTHLLFNMEDGDMVAVEIGTQRISANRMDNLTDEYRKKNIAVKWIVIADAEISVREDQTYFLKRYLLNESLNKDLIVVSWDAAKISQHKVDSSKYEYNGRNIESDNYPNTYTEVASLNDLTFDGNELSLAGFTSRYEAWLHKKRKAFCKKITQLEEESRQQMEAIKQQEQERSLLYHERQELLKKTGRMASPVIDELTSANHIPSKPSQPSLTYGQLKQEVLPLIEQQQKQARDSLGNRWVKCEKCGFIDIDDKFVSYGGPGRINIGTCNNCSGSKRPPSR